MRFGLASPIPTDGPKYLKVRNLDIQVAYLAYLGYWWPQGMIDPVWIHECDGANKAIMSFPMLVGSPTGSPVDAYSGTGQTSSPQDPSGANSFTTMTLAAVAAGTWDFMFGQAFQTIASVRPDCILRIGWEQNIGSGYPWAGPGLITGYAAAFRHLVALARTYSSKFQFDWNGCGYFTGFDPFAAGVYPGDAWVDYITYDAYASFIPGGAAGFATYAASTLDPGIAFAKAHGKKYGWPEWGLHPSGVADDWAWVKAAYDWLRKNQADIAYACWYENNKAPTPWPNCLAVSPQTASLFPELFGAWAQSNAGQSSHRYLTTSGVDRLRVQSR